MTTKPELKPCPFCGGKPEIIDVFNEADWGVIRCKRCKGGIGGDTLVNVSKKWNRRVK